MEFEPKIFRTFVFVRHGQYSSTPEKLTKLGREQAQLTAKAINQLSPAKIHSSTMPRALETASIIARQTNLKFKSNDLFREGLLPGTVEFNNSITKELSRTRRKEFLIKARLAKETADV